LSRRPGSALRAQTRAAARRAQWPLDARLRASWSEPPGPAAQRLLHPIRVAVAMNVAPQRGHAVDVGVPIGVVQIDPFGLLDDQRFLVLAPGALLGEGVPEMPAVGGLQ